MGDKLDEINRLNIRIAKEAAAEFSTPDRPRFVIGSVGPGTKMPSLDRPGHLRRLRHARRRLPAAAPRHDRGARRRDPDRDVLRHPPGEVRGDHRDRGDEAGRRAAAADGATHHHRREQEDAAGHGHPGRARRARPARRDRRARHELRRRPGPDARRHPPPEPAQPQAAQRAAERRPARDARRRDVLPARPERAGRLAGAVRHRVRREHHRRLLRHDARTTSKAVVDRVGGKKPATRTPDVPARGVQPASRRRN